MTAIAHSVSLLNENTRGSIAYQMVMFAEASINVDPTIFAKAVAQATQYYPHGHSSAIRGVINGYKMRSLAEGLDPRTVIFDKYDDVSVAHFCCDCDWWRTDGVENIEHRACRVVLWDFGAAIRERYVMDTHLYDEPRGEIFLAEIIKWMKTIQVEGW